MKTKSGFTIVELLIVIVVIGILAAISIVAYNGIQQRGRDTQRLHDMSAITKALEIYKIQTGSYPESSYNGTNGFEVSSINPSSFLDDLVAAKVVSKVPVDPINTGNASGTSRVYAYYRYPAGYGGCDTSRGDYYVLIVWTGDSSTTSPSSPHFGCGTNYMGGWWTGGNYTN